MSSLIPTMRKCSVTHTNVIDKDMDQFRKEVKESHDSKPYFCGRGNLLEFFIGFGASFNQPNWVLYELPTLLNKLHYLIHDALGDGGLRRQKPVRVSLLSWKECAPTGSLHLSGQHYLRFIQIWGC